MRRILLINPGVDWELRPFDAAPKLPFMEAKAFMTPLAIATIATLTPDDIEVDLWDEEVHGPINDSAEFRKEYDLAGITGYVPHLTRAKQIAQVFQKRGIPMAIGGAGVSSAPELCRGVFDILFIGEAELTWPRFIRDWKAGSYRSEYRQVSKPDLTLTPPPKWDSLADCMGNYIMGAVQTSRGCPFNCEFCDVVHLYGRRLRQKPIDRVLEEISVLERLGMRKIFFCDDNFVGNPRYTKDLVRELVSLNRSFENPMGFSTELSINVAKDDELLELLADSNFRVISIGIETPNKESLLEVNKLQNYNTNLLEDIRKIQSYGIAVRAATIVGFDHDDITIFDQQFEFLQEACVTLLATHTLRAPIGTKLWTRLRKEGRVVLDEQNQAYWDSFQYHKAVTNVIPKRMTRVELFSGYLDFLEKEADWGYFEERVKGFVSGVKRMPKVPQEKRALRWKFAFRFLKYLLFSVDKEARRATFRILRYTSDTAPFMLGTVRSIIGNQFSRLAILQVMRESLRRQIELESSEGFELHIDQGDSVIPESFKKPYQEIFSDIYRRVYQDLTDKSRAEEALIEVFTDFINRWEKTLDQFSDQHKDSLYEFADNAVEKRNSETTQLFPPFLQEDQELLAIKQDYLADEILKAVEQELRATARAG